MTDDLGEAFGWEPWEDTLRLTLNASGGIVGWGGTTDFEDADRDLEDLDAFFDWAREANPQLFEMGGACRDGSDAECAVSLLELAEEYAETEHP